MSAKHTSSRAVKLTFVFELDWPFYPPAPQVRVAGEAGEVSEERARLLEFQNRP